LSDPTKTTELGTKLTTGVVKFETVLAHGNEFIVSELSKGIFETIKFTKKNVNSHATDVESIKVTKKLTIAERAKNFLKKKKKPTKS